MIKALTGFMVVVLLALFEIVSWVVLVSLARDILDFLESKFIKRLEKRAQRESERDSGGDL